MVWMWQWFHARGEQRAAERRWLEEHDEPSRLDRMDPDFAANRAAEAKGESDGKEPNQASERRS